MDSSPIVKMDETETETTVSQHAENSVKKKKKKKKKKKDLKCVNGSDSQVGSTNYSNCVAKEQTYPEGIFENTLEEKAEIKVPISEEVSHSVDFKNPVEIKCESNRKYGLDQLDNNMTPSEIGLPCDGTAVGDETSSTTDSTTKKKLKKKNNKGSFEKKEEVQAVDFKDPKRPESQNKQADSIEPGDDDTVHTVPNDEKSTSNSPVSSRKKKKKKKAGGILLSQLSLSEPRNDSDKEKQDSGADEKKLPDEEQQVTSMATDNDLKKCTEERSLLQPNANERNNFSKVLTITYGTGLDTLRKLFLRIHPTWSNKPDDAKHFAKGRINLQKHELIRFNTGNINDWDVSLITTVLLFSKLCAKEIKKMGFEDAVRTIKEQKNLLLSHANSERMTDDEFSTAWDKISKSLKTIGARTKDIDDILIDDTLESAKFYRDMFLQELANKHEQRAVLQDINTRIEKMGDEVAEKVVSRLSCKSNAMQENQPRIQDFGPKFDEWMRFCEDVQNFDDHKNNYVLITDSMSPENLDYFSILRSVPWKIVLDFDPSSEEKGMYHDFVKKEGTNSLIDMITPAELQRHSTSNLARHIDTRKTQWLFVRGREKDNLASGGTLAVYDWRTSSVKHISGFFRCCCDPDKLDKHKPLICVILPFLKETLPFFQVTLERLVENFDEFRLQMVGMKHENIPSDLQKEYDIRLTDLSPGLLSLGLRDLLEVCPGKEYRMPTCQAKLPVKLTHHQYLYLQEYLEVLYDGCEDLPDLDDEKKFEQFLNNHRESFLSGNWISFVSLFDNHDARREVGDDVQRHIQRLLDQGLTHSTIIEIQHAPGTGGTTIARRVLWGLHKSYPCAIARLKDHKCDLDDDFHFINDLADRISAMHEICQTYPLILLDGNHSRIEALTNKLVRLLNKKGQRAVLLRCLHRSAKEHDIQTNSETSDVHERFSVKVRLEDSLADLNQFREKYKDYIDKFQKSGSSLCRVFHFPLLAMLPGFGSKLKQIVHESFDEMDGLQKEIAVVVAFIQHYAAQETPASLLYKAFKKYVSDGGNGKGITYKEINQLITDQLLNLMVPAKPTRYPRPSSTSSVPVSFTLQHPLVAEMVLKRYCETQKCDIIALTREFLEFPIFQDEQFFSLVNSLFIRNRLPKSRFSILFEELRTLNSQTAAELFRKLAKKTGDAIVFAYAARFHAKNYPPSYQEATDLISEAFMCKNAQSKSRIINDMKGQILQSQLKFLVDKSKIKSISQLEDLADKALQSYLKSRNWPLTYPYPLMGEVKVWISCIDWITKNECNGDTDKAFEFITSKAPPFFHTCIGDSFHLLVVVDSIVQKEANLADPEEVQKQANDLRMSLLRTFNKDKGRGPGRRDKESDIIRASQALCSTDKFPKCSPVELKRLQVHYILSCIDQIEAMKNEHIHFLFKLLEDLVFLERGNSRIDMVGHLMKVCLLITGPKCYSLDKGVRVADMWVQQSGYDSMPYFYKMMIYFIGILDGNQVSYRDKYNKALDKCRDMSQNHCRRLASTHYLKNSGEGMTRLMTKSDFLTGETGYPQNVNVEDFWTTQSRKKLLECSGRVRIRPKSGKRKQVYIELVQGNIEVYVSKNVGIGKAERDYNPGTIVYFVVSFNLEGPVANGITFKPTSTSTK